MTIAPLRQFVLGALNWTVEWYDPDRYPVSTLSERLSKLLLESIALDNGRSLVLVTEAKPQNITAAVTAQSKSARTHAKVLSAAARIIRDRGCYKAASMRAIAKDAGIKAFEIC